MEDRGGAWRGGSHDIGTNTIVFGTGNTAPSTSWPLKAGLFYVPSRTDLLRTDHAGRARPGKPG
ncbi:MAG: hypothetical protein ACKO2N_16625, partial [Tabrizicola sp.]